MNINETNNWKFIEEYFEKYGLVHHQLSAYNDFVTHGIQKIVDAYKNITITDSPVTISFGKVFIPKPFVIECDRRTHSILPNDCRKRGLTYDVPVHVDIYSETNGETQIHRRIPLFRIPVMVGSSLCSTFDMTTDERLEIAQECMNDPGGYFIINGNERAIVSQIRNVPYNVIHVLTPSAVERKKYILKAETRSISEETGHSVQIQAFIGTDRRTISIQLPYVNTLIPAGILFEAMGIDTSNLIDLVGVDHEEVHTILRHQHYEASILASSREDALTFIGKRGSKDHENDQKYAEQLLATEIFPHLGLTSTREEKAFFLLYIVKKLLLTYVGEMKESNRDDIQYKRIENVSILLYDLTQRLFKSTLDKIIHSGHLDVTSLSEQMNRKLTTGLHYCFATGKWGVQRNAYIRVGVSQNLNRMSYLGTLSHLRRIVSPIGKEGKNVQIRQVQPSHLGFIDLSETPEGQQAGIVMNLAATVLIAEETSTIQTKEVLEREIEIQPISSLSETLFILNGNLLGVIDDVPSTMEKLYQLRRYQILHPHSSIVHDPFENEIRMFTDRGRMIRPLLTKPITFETPLSLEQAEKEHLVQFLDAHEIDQAVLGFYANEKADYYEIHPALMNGVCTGSIPFPDHSQAPRNCYSASMMKQGLGIFATSYQHRADTTSNVLLTPQKPLVNTAMDRALKLDEMPAGVNCIVAICCYNGSNQEDSLLVNKSAIERGLFHSMLYKTHGVEEVRSLQGGSSKIITVPPHSIRKYGLNYTMLDHNGIIRKGSVVTANDILVGMVSEIRDNKDEKVQQSDASFYGETGIVDRIYVSIMPQGGKMVKIVMRELRIPQIGDKLASKCAQKGTCCMLMPTEDMPFTMQDGIVPDLVINSHALPSQIIRLKGFSNRSLVSISFWLGLW